MTVRINKQKINLREKLAGVEDKVNFDEVVRGLGEYTGNVGIGTTNPEYQLHIASASPYIELKDTNSVDESATTAIRFAHETEEASVLHAYIGRAGSQDFRIFNTGDITFATGGVASSDVKMRINSAGNVGIGIANPAGFKLNVQSDVNTVPIKGYRATTTTNSYLLILNSNVGGNDLVKFRVEADGDVISATNSYTSDERAKAEISDLNYGLDTIKQLQPKQFKMRHSEEKGFKYGFIAQEVETILPDLIRNDGIEDGEGGSYKALEYNSIIAILTKAIQEQQTIINDLKSRIETLEQQ